MQAFKSLNELENKREIETEGTFFLLNKLFASKDFVLEYTPTKKPILKGVNAHISISHSYDKLAILVNTEQSTGVDVELIRDKVCNIQHKFLNEHEIKFAQNDSEILTVLWAAKESIFKAYGLKELDFKSNIFINSFDQAENNFCGRLDLPNFKKKYLLSKTKIDNYILVYILSEI